MMNNIPSKSKLFPQSGLLNPVELGQYFLESKWKNCKYYTPKRAESNDYWIDKKYRIDESKVTERYGIECNGSTINVKIEVWVFNDSNYAKQLATSFDENWNAGAAITGFGSDHITTVPFAINQAPIYSNISLLWAEKYRNHQNNTIASVSSSIENVFVMILVNRSGKFEDDDLYDFRNKLINLLRFVIMRISNSSLLLGQN